MCLDIDITLSRTCFDCGVALWNLKVKEKLGLGIEK